MKFQHLPVGARFRFEGAPYVKTSPLAAADAAGKSRLIPRWAVLSPESDDAPPPVQTPPAALPRGEVLAAFATYQATCRAALVAAGASPAQLAAFEAAEAGFLASLTPTAPAA